MRVAILTDTNSGIAPSEAADLGIFVMPMPIIINDEIFFEGKNITEEKFYEELTSGKNVSTSMPSPADVMEMWDDILSKGYDELVYIPMSSGLSSSCSAAIGFAEEYDGKVAVSDNHRIAVTMRPAVLLAKKLADEGKMNAREIADYLEKDAYSSSIYVSVNTLEYLKKGGRVTPAAAAIGTVLNIKPLLTIQGEKLDSFAKIRGTMKKCQERMLDEIANDIEKRFPKAKPEDVWVGAAGAGFSDEEIEEWTNMVRERFPKAHVYYDPLSASIGTHVGPGAAGIGVSVDGYFEY